MLEIFLGLNLSEKFLTILPPEYIQFFYFGTTLNLIFRVFYNLAFWIIITIVFHTLILIFNGESKFKKLLELSAYTFIPLIISTLIALIAYNLFPIKFSSEILKDPKLVTNLLKKNIAYQIHSSAKLFFGGWFLILNIILVKILSQFSYKKSFLIVFLPTTLYFLIVTMVQ